MINFLGTTIKKIRNYAIGEYDYLIGLQEVRDGLGINKKGNVISYITLNGFDVDISRESEINVLLTRHLELLDNKIFTPLSYNVYTFPDDLKDVTKFVNDGIDNSQSFNSKGRLKLFNAINNFNLASKYFIPKRSFVIALSYDVEVEKKNTLLGRIFGKDDFYFFNDNNWKIIKAKIEINTRVIVDAINSFSSDGGLGARAMTEKETYSYFKQVYGNSGVVKQDSRFIF